ncbi:TPA: class I SAM-dependent methyltransferase [Candidatus Woesearchaeota archaeon]|nr:class I SAM-dependent methyltransferase [Candidatus Woesearchaeota archaeon]
MTQEPESIDDTVINDLTLVRFLADKSGNKKGLQLPLSSEVGFEQASTSPEYHLLGTTENGRVHSDFRGSLPDIVNGRILDIGCSRGETTNELSGRYKESEVIGIDINRAAISEAIASRRKGKFQVANGYCPQRYFPEKSFDAVFMMNNLLYAIDKLSDDRLAEILGNVKSVVKPGGYLLISGKRQYYVFKIADDIVTLETPLSQIHESFTGRVYGARLTNALGCVVPKEMEDFDWLLREGAKHIKEYERILDLVPRIKENALYNFLNRIGKKMKEAS